MNSSFGYVSAIFGVSESQKFRAVNRKKCEVNIQSYEEEGYEELTEINGESHDFVIN
jgi:hypothetical protein